MCIHISVKRWKDKVNGNSYFSGLIFRDGVIVARMPFQYGYGSQPDAVAAVEIRNAGIIPDKGERFNWAYATSALREAGIPCTYDEAWTTKRECKAHAVS